MTPNGRKVESAARAVDRSGRDGWTLLPPARHARYGHLRLGDRHHVASVTGHRFTG
ncbi:hypothetical protein [Nocardia sp. Marseille-Q1738]